MSLNIVADKIAALMHYICSKGEDVNWLDWLSLSELAFERPDMFIEAFNSLSLEEQFKLLKLMSKEDSGILADILICALTEKAVQIKDDNIKVMLSEYSITAHERNIKRLDNARKRVEVMNEAVSNLEKRFTEGFDLAEEEERIKMKLEQLRSEEWAKDEEALSRLYAVEDEILRLEAKKRILENYKPEERISLLKNLEFEVTNLEKIKIDTEENIGSLIGDRDILQKQVKSLEGEAENLKETIESDKEKLTKLNKEVEAAKKEIQDFNANRKALDEEKVKLKEQISELEDEANKNKGITEKLRKQLEDIMKTADRVKVESIIQKTKELFRMLPEDDVDGMIKKK